MIQSSHSSGAGMLRRLADVLGVSPEMFYQGEPSGFAETGQINALLDAFRRIEDPELRKECLRLVEAASAAAKAGRGRS